MTNETTATEGTVEVESVEQDQPVAIPGDYMDRALNIQGEFYRLISSHDVKKSLNVKIKSQVQALPRLVIDQSNEIH